MADFKRIIQRTTNSERVETGVADLQPNEICIVEDGEELIYKDRNGKYISVSKDKYKINTIEDLKSSKKYKVGDVVEVLGYYTAGNGGGHIRKISKTDDGSGVLLANGLWANIVHDGEVNVSWFGINENTSRQEVYQKLQIIANLDHVSKIINNVDYGFYRGFKFFKIDKDLIIHDSSISYTDSTLLKTHGTLDRYFYFTKNSDTGIHNGNGHNIYGRWHPYYMVNNSKDDTKDRYASIFFSLDNIAQWRVGQGTTRDWVEEKDAVDFVIAANGLDDLGVSNLTSIFSILKKNGYIGFNNKLPLFPYSFHSRAEHESNRYNIDLSNNLNSPSFFVKLTKDNSIEFTTINGVTSFSYNGSRCYQMTDDGLDIVKNLMTQNKISSQLGTVSNRSLFINANSAINKLAFKDNNGIARDFDGEQFSIRRNGVTSGRPTNANIGFMYFDTTLGKPVWWNGTSWRDSTGTSALVQLNTPYHTAKMQQEGVYEDFIQYMDKKTEYDRLQRELEQQRQLAFEQSGMENYEEWLAEQPMMLPVENEPQPSESLLKFKEKYLG